MRIESSAPQFAPTVSHASPQFLADGASAGGDLVQLSSLAQFSMGDSPKVPGLAAEFAAGRYFAAPHQIATGMIAEHTVVR